MIVEAAAVVVIATKMATAVKMRWAVMVTMERVKEITATGGSGDDSGGGTRVEKM